ncbi:methylated-DNA--[protein]-cysteine S-methyltransferase [Hymenobacter metallilatus]|uniref:Methylated-DNA--protein-cysteine methyltransferase n=1 Tax=Hymenobacter metallilatus TaxID=2493666 RepID=A0A428JTJ7_9BACT|nr:methylated-DNA--[protein]-cysteine S-methyltransferase [Hymenobacter metallilatus]RSK37409.1 methylated-DNA--[protein]-cysteine S-methyltransferase [Hymenobacter metallilatus]
MSEATAILPTPLGALELRGTEAGLRSIRFMQEPATADTQAPGTPLGQVAGCLREAHRQLQAYFGRELQEFTLATDIISGTGFQQLVWTALPLVSYGHTASYLDIARQLGSPGAVRAVGAANGQNPLAIIWPCHRIIGANGQLTGYAGGLSRKRWLLDFERPSLQTSLF